MFWNQKFESIVRSLDDPKKFWDNWKKCSEIHKPINTNSSCSGKEWFDHFNKLYETKKPLMQDPAPSVPPCEALNAPFTSYEMEKAIMKLKNNKAGGLDRITNEMLKCTPRPILTLLLDFINLCLEKSLISTSLCRDLIVPIFKDGHRDDPDDYRGLCLLSAIIKLMMLMFEERIQNKSNSMNLIHKNQIGFRKKCRTSDHLLALKAIVKKYVTIGKSKLYVGFVDFKKAYDSIPHMKLLNRMRKIGLHGNLLDLIENIYLKTKCAVKVNNKITEFFNYANGVRQGCPLSPLLFNLYVNDIIENIDSNTIKPIKLNKEIVNVLMYADDLILIAESEKDLQSQFLKLSNMCRDKDLEINTKKTKCMVFNRGNKLCKANIVINDKTIENVKHFKYLGFTIGAKNCNFSNTLLDLSTKAKKAIFALNNKIKLSLIPVELSLKIFASQIAPILLYGSEVWGPYLNTDFNTWEKGETEKTHTQFLKRILGCNIQTSNIMTRAEVGRRPMLTDIIIRNSMYIRHVRESPKSLAFAALEVEKESRNEAGNIFGLLDKFVDPTDQEQDLNNKYTLKKMINLNYDEKWKTDMLKSSKADSYITHKNFPQFEVYFQEIKNNKHRRALTRLRLSSHQLMIEKGRHLKPFMERSMRKCKLCTHKIEDEAHFLIECPLYEKEREQLEYCCIMQAPNFANLNTQQKYIFIMTNENAKLLELLGKFVFNAFKLHEEWAGWGLLE